MGVLSWGNMVSLRFQETMPPCWNHPATLYSARPVPTEVGRHSEIDGAPFRKRWGTVTALTKKRPTSLRNQRPTSIGMGAPLQSESVPHFARNPQPDRQQPGQVVPRLRMAPT